MTALVATLAGALWQLRDFGAGLAWPWLGVLIAAAIPMAFFMRLFLSPTARTGSLWWLPLAGIPGVVLAWGEPAVMMLALLVGTVLPLIYVHWYSRFADREVGQLQPGQTLPAFRVHDIDGQAWTSADLSTQPALWLFYRGNWCPLCMAQIREIAASYRALGARGVRTYLVSPQPEENTQSLARQFEVPMTFLTDRDNQAARTLGILAENGLPAGLQLLGYDSDVPMPTVFITDTGGKLIYSDLTSNYRLRPEPEAFIAALDAAGITGAATS